MKNTLKYIFIAVLMLLAVNAKAWFDAGHMVVAQIAYNQLDNEERKEVDRLIALLADADPDYTNFVQAATWMDGIKGTALYYFNTQHYINQYYVVSPVNPLPGFNEENVVSLIEQSTRTLQSKRASDFSKALALRLLIHAVGDIHQPMHTCSMVSEQFPNGDLGGNLFKLEPIIYGTDLKGEPGELNNLHKLWDSGLMFFADVHAADYPEKQSALNQDIEKITAFVKRNDKEGINDRLTITEPAIWAKESYYLAVENAYNNIAPGEKPSPKYIRNGEKVVMLQSYIAGMRLAKLLKEIF